MLDQAHKRTITFCAAIGSMRAHSPLTLPTCHASCQICSVAVGSPRRAASSRLMSPQRHCWLLCWGLQSRSSRECRQPPGFKSAKPRASMLSYATERRDQMVHRGNVYWPYVPQGLSHSSRRRRHRALTRRCRWLSRPLLEVAPCWR